MNSLTSVSGILLLDKPLGLSSNQALSRVKKLYPRVKMGHMGSLDPLATGLLPLCLGEATKFAHYGLHADKTYEAIIELGVRTQTGDREGAIIEECPVTVSLERIQQVLASFVGEHWQTPPMYSALKHQGKKLYDLARQGLTVERAPRQVQITFLECLAIALPCVHIRVGVSKGTYIRTLAEDIGSALGCGAHLGALRRVALAPFSTEGWQTLEGLTQMLPEVRIGALQPIEALIPDWQSCFLSAEESVAFRLGQELQIKQLTLPLQRLRFYEPRGAFLGIGSLDEAGWVRKRRVLRF